MSSTPRVCGCVGVGGGGIITCCSKESKVRLTGAQDKIMQPRNAAFISCTGGWRSETAHSHSKYSHKRGAVIVSTIAALCPLWSCVTVLSGWCCSRLGHTSVTTNTAVVLPQHTCKAGDRSFSAPLKSVVKQNVSLWYVSAL